MKIFDSAAVLLIVTGGLIGLTFPLGKLAAEAGVSPVNWTFLITASAGTVLGVAVVARGGLPRLSGHFLRYILVSALISFVIPNLILFSVVEGLGAGFVGLFYTLSPVVTLAFAMVFGTRVPHLLGLAGIAIGFAGAVTLTLSRGVDAPNGELALALVAMLIPVALAAGNIYRTIDWPEGVQPLTLAAASNLAGALELALISLVMKGRLPLDGLWALPSVTLLQAAGASAMFAIFYRLQRVGGPVYLSQVGYVAAAVGLFSGVAFMGERYAPLTWIGAGVIALGVGLSILEQRRAEKPQ